MAPRRHRPARQAPPASQTSVTAPDNKSFIWAENLNIVRKRVPGVLRIFDRFTHVSVFRCDKPNEEVVWEKLPYEGAMFLFEREDYPHYGYFILNRVGVDDWISYIRPEDEIDLMEGTAYVYHYTFPDFSARREAAYSRPPTPRSDAREVYSVSKEDKMPRVVHALWMLITDEREPLGMVLPRLMEYIKKGQRYPEKYHYGPHKDPPPNPQTDQRLVEQNQNRARANAARSPQTAAAVPTSPGKKRQQRGANPSNADDSVHVSNTSLSISNGALHVSQASTSISVQSHGQDGSVSHVDRLFSAMSASADPIRAATVNPAHAPSASRKLTVGELLASASASAPATSLLPPAAPTSHSTASVGSSSSSATVVPPSGHALLASLFASAVDPAQSAPSPSMNASFRFPPEPQQPHHPHPQAPTHPSQHHPHASHSQPQYHPQSYPPQSHYPPPEPTIVAPRPTQGSVPQILTQDVISALMGLRPPSSRPSTSTLSTSNGRRSVTASEAELSDTSTALDSGEEQDAAGASAGVPLLSPHAEHEAQRTPRMPLRMALPISRASPAASASPRRPEFPAFLSESRVQQSEQADVPPAAHFADGSAQWAALEEGDGVLELDFADTRALADPGAFETRLRTQASPRVEPNVAKAPNGKAQDKGKGLNGTAQDKGKARANGVVANGHAAGANGASAANSAPAGLDKDSARDALLTTVIGSKGASLSKLSRNEFMSEVCTLIYTDKSFVDKMYGTYLQRTA